MALITELMKELNYPITKQRFVLGLPIWLKELVEVVIMIHFNKGFS